ncbi:PLP-dependent aminotransferase family protein [Defluviitalea raffinosedens]|uniref:MocR-like pyridoxine biosynthesis transcription factor PdxR n=1 Tax=Defluviitalea raffinosedens TaxID=1450156 RepID=UPI00195CBE90|nr:PLP-dependent aminotransferase family protein [Defluviitalea raffinosedens]MBM7686158.1 GntR family transcriptional regulator/MocR family aminotransferase [Defluviitalea raffinosedens]
MLTYDFENVKEPLYEYIYKCIKSDIVSGNLKPGEKLPSKRTFAHNNGISTITIQNAYDQLISEGYVYSLPKKGYFVADIDVRTSTPKEAKITLDIKLPEEKAVYDIDLSNNEINPDNFPFSIWAKLSREIISNKKKELMEASPTGGKYEVRAAIAEHLKSFRGMLVDPNQIVIGAGTEYLYGLIIQLLGKDKSYCIENPGYKKLLQIYKQYNIECKFADMDDMGITVDGLKKSGAEVVHISPNHHFPTGITMPASRRYEVLAWANEKDDRYIIEDDYDSEFRYNGKPIPTLFSIDACEKVIYMNTFSKSLTSTMRISYMVLPVHLANRFYEQLSFYSCTVSNFEQYTLAALINKGYFEKHINRMRLHYTRQRKLIIDTIMKSKLGKKCEIIENDSGLHFLIKLYTHLSDQEVTNRLKKKGIQMKALSEYYLEPEKSKPHYFIINYSNIDISKISEACETIYSILE